MGSACAPAFLSNMKFKSVIYLVLFSIVLVLISPDTKGVDHRYTEPYQFNSEFILKKFNYRFSPEWNRSWFDSRAGFRTSEGSLDTYLLMLNRELKWESELVKENLVFKLNYIQYKNQDFSRNFLKYQFMQKIWKQWYVLIFGVSEYEKIYSDFGAGIAWRRDSLNYVELKLLKEDFLYNMKAEENSNYRRGYKPRKVILEANFHQEKWIAHLEAEVSTMSVLVNSYPDTETLMKDREEISESKNFAELFFEYKVNKEMIDYAGLYFNYIEDSGKYSYYFINPFGDKFYYDDYRFSRPAVTGEIFAETRFKKLKLVNSILFGSSKFKWREYTYPTNNNDYSRNEYGYSVAATYKWAEWFSTDLNYFFMYSRIKQDFPKPDVEDFDHQQSENTFTVAPVFYFKKANLGIFVNYDMDSNTFDGGNIQFQMEI